MGLVYTDYKPENIMLKLNDNFPFLNGGIDNLTELDKALKWEPKSLIIDFNLYLLKSELKEGGLNDHIAGTI